MGSRTRAAGFAVHARHIVTLLVLLLCLVVPLAAAGCGTQPAAKASGGAPARGGTFIVTNGEPSTLDPAVD